ncbi:MAG TPA: S8 family serine peptidase [Skermanella sp.]|nr:S8 family serine peptidase [Skermanella sp.]
MRQNPGLPKHKRSSVDLANGFEGRHWESEDGHGSMCAGIAAGTSRDGGRYNGVAPDAQVLAARCDLTMDGIIRTYECLLRMRAEGKILGPLVISNSFSPKGCAPSQNADDQHPLIEFVRLAVNMLRIPVIFSAGNNHRHCGHDPRSHEPSTIWGVNSIDEVLTIGAVAHDGSNQKPDFPHSHSSRGPGELHRSHPKPDCVAPTFGEVVYGDDYRRMSWWGTSGAAPQAAGLAALLLSKNSSFLPSEVADLIRNTATPLNFHPFCVGRGLINCAEAIASL